jgi:hypothetical protein
LSVALGYDAATGVLSGRINRKDTGRCCCTLSHATLPEKDIKLMLVPDENGTFSAGLLERSRWIVLVEGRSALAPGRLVDIRRSAAWRSLPEAGCRVPAVMAFSMRGSSSSISRLLTRSRPSFLNLDSRRLMLSMVRPR